MIIDTNMPIMDYVEMHTLYMLDISAINDEEYFGNGWVIIHSSVDRLVKGFHYIEIDHTGDDYLKYIAENDIDEDDIIYFGMVDGYILKVIQILKE